TRSALPRVGSPEAIVSHRCVNRPSFSSRQTIVVSWPSGTVHTLVDEKMPPSSPEYVRTTPRRLVTSAACQSAWTYGGPPAGPIQSAARFQVGVAARPLRERTPQSSPPKSTWLASVGSTATAWLNHPCPPTISSVVLHPRAGLVMVPPIAA